MRMALLIVVLTFAGLWFLPMSAQAQKFGYNPYVNKYEPKGGSYNSFTDRYGGPNSPYNNWLGPNPYTPGSYNSWMGPDYSYGRPYGYTGLDGPLGYGYGSRWSRVLW